MQLEHLAMAQSILKWYEYIHKLMFMRSTRQVNSGMWRRNGFSLTNQIYYYHNVRCRQEMLDRDHLLLQEAATLIDANEFLIHLLNRYNLIAWARNDREGNFLKVGYCLS